METIILSALAIIIAAIMLRILLLPSGNEAPSKKGITIELGSDDRKVVRVRSAEGPWMTLVVPYELGDEGESIPEIPQDVVRRNEPELYAEYMAPETGVDRRMEIADILYGMGYVLPLHADMYQRMREQMSKGSGRQKGYRRLDLDRSVAVGFDAEGLDEIEGAPVEQTVQSTTEESPNEKGYEENKETPDRDLGGGSPEHRGTDHRTGPDIHGAWRA